MEKLKVLECFAGIGACSKALTNLGIEYEIVDAVEIDKYAVKSFNAIHGTNFEPQDICEWDKNVEVDLIIHGSPCQDYSIGGNQQGGDKGSGTRSSLMYESIRIIEKLRPKYVIWENVKNLLNKKHKHNFDNYCDKLEVMGYKNYYKVLNAKDFGVPQNRERVITVSIRNDFDIDFQFDNTIKELLPLSQFLDKLDYTYSSDKYIKYSNFFTIPRNTDNRLINGSYNRIWDINKFVGTIPTMQGIIKIGEINLQDNRVHYRILTAKEALLLMGFDKSDYDKVKIINCEREIYKQAGNSIVVDMLVSILRQLLKG